MDTLSTTLTIFPARRVWGIVGHLRVTLIFGTMKTMMKIFKKKYKTRF